MKKTIAMILTVLLVVAAFAGCAQETETPADSTVSASGQAPAGSEAAAEEDLKEIIMISKSYQNMFYQAAFKGAQDAGAELGYEIVTMGPDNESNITQQVEQIASAVNQEPDAILLAAIDTASAFDALSKAKDMGIPVIGFDSGVPDDESGAVVATSATDNTAAGAFVAEQLFADPTFQERMSEGTEENPTVVGILAQDSTSGSIVLRVNGFVEKMTELLQTLPEMEGAVEVSGQTLWNMESENPAKITLAITVPPSTTQADIQTAATQMLTNEMVAVFAANQGAVDGLLGATADGTDLDRESGKYKDLIVVGFDAGAGQKAAVSTGAFFGSVTQDPYNMGYQAVQMVADIAEGGTPADIDTGAKWYNAENINDEDISILLYD